MIARMPGRSSDVTSRTAATATMAARAYPPGLIILSGGGAAELSRLLSLPFELHDNLVLDGLQLIARSA